MNRYIAESFLALKAVDGAFTPPIAPSHAMNYKSLMDHKWHEDPKCQSHGPACCMRGWHAFPLSNLSNWWPRDNWSSRGDRHVWVVEMWGQVDYDADKLATSHIRFVSRLSNVELHKLAATYRPRYGWSQESQNHFIEAARIIRIEGLVLARIDDSYRKGRGAWRSPKLIRVEAP